METIASLLAFTFFILLGIILVRAAYYQYRAAALRQPNVSFFDAFNLLYLILFPSFYTEDGKIARRNCLQSMTGFIVLAVIMTLLRLFVFNSSSTWGGD
jgi:hypothetical protein